MKRWWKSCCVACVAIGALSGCGHAGDEAGAGTVPTSAEAREVVGRALDLATTSAADVCDIASSKANCEIMLQSAVAVPAKGSSTIVCDAAYGGDGHHVAGRLVRVRGVNGAGQAFDSTLLVIRSNGAVTVLNPVFWVSTGINVSGVTGRSLSACEP